ncbi:hypothetical protein TH66_06065 [Carbonactinospora thermoautotrophica]|uniref:HTH cro/C1-type domain-containing protein n=1 Tax=Carbonactinospora thermoautotrophica TaxID=1469144 RepID=A0A132N3T9_9ACTN|nr:transcriptional regulator [Carbonactinospora thermoautotrophica]KWX04753.1 hypothetical protein TH66_06065 [Carbonactinospora thermoautotrophica]KWX07925.1 hypothetical protein TR74_17130 [Carbonactinospora thermoautotrophica]
MPDTTTAAARTPNLVLRSIRHQMCLSQAEFAEEIVRVAREMGLSLACDEKRVGRWERGEVRWPQPAYRRVLKALTGRPAQELGFVPPYEETPA